MGVHLFLFSRQLPISQPEILRLAQCLHKAGRIIFFPFIEAVNLLVEVAVKVEWSDVNVGAFDASFQKAPKVFESVGMYDAINVPFCVVDNFVRVFRCAEILI